MDLLPGRRKQGRGHGVKDTVSCSAWPVWAVSAHWCCSGPQIPLAAFTFLWAASPVGLHALAVEACVFFTAPCSHQPSFWDHLVPGLSPAGCPKAVCGCWNNRSGVWVMEDKSPFPLYATKNRSDDKDKKVQVHWFIRALSHKLWHSYLLK